MTRDRLPRSSLVYQVLICLVKHQKITRVTLSQEEVDVNFDGF
jgi:hypothetical protein